MEFKHETIIETSKKETVIHPSEFDAFGLPVPSHRKQAAYKWLKDEIGFSTKLSQSIIGKAAHFVEKDETVHIIGDVTSLDEDLRNLDLTGRYRLLSMLVTN